jgi:hypothetical protein
MQTWRHGDVMIATAPAIPDGARRRPTAVLARGEATGHSHRIEDAGTAEVFDHKGAGYLRVVGESALLVHDEHNPIRLPRGTYRFWQQREYTPQAIRTIAD